MRGIYSNRKGMRASRALWLVLPLVAAVALAAALLPGTGSAQSQTAPQNTGAPSILGTPVEGNTLTATNGTWSDSPTTFKYEWLRCPSEGGAANGSNCAVISSATKSTYQLGTADVGLPIRVRVTASNTDGSTSAASNATSIVTAAGKKPASTSSPAISGTPAVGQTLTANPGTWSGGQPISYSYQWRRCDKIGGGSCSDISGATGKTYALKSVDAGNTLRISVTAKNSAGATSATSVPTAVVTATPTPPATGCPSGTGPIQIAQLSPPARLLIDHQQVSPNPVTRSTTSIVARFHVTACGGRSVQGALIYATTVPFSQFSIPLEQPTGADGWIAMRMQRQSGFPATRHQRLLVMFGRARKAGENELGGISTRRLVASRVKLSG